MAAPREQARGRPGAAAHGPRDVRLHAGRGFAERARRELLATGETVRNRMSGTRDELTAWERQIAWRARDGRSNAEIGAKLFLSPRTVEWHLRKVLTKLGISSRAQLREALPTSAA